MISARNAVILAATKVTKNIGKCGGAASIAVLILLMLLTPLMKV